MPWKPGTGEVAVADVRIMSDLNRSGYIMLLLLCVHDSLWAYNEGEWRCAIKVLRRTNGKGQKPSNSSLLPPAQILEGSAARISMHDFFRI